MQPKKNKTVSPFNTALSGSDINPFKDLAVSNAIPNETKNKISGVIIPVNK